MKSLKWSMIGILISLLGCSDNLPLVSGRWSGEGAAPPRPPHFDEKAGLIPLGTQKLVFQSQKIDGVEIEGTYYKEISSEKPEFITFKWAQSLPVNLRAQLLLMKSHASSIESDFFKKHPDYDPKDLVHAPELVVQNGSPRWKFAFQTGSGEIEGLSVDRSLHILSKELMGSHYVSAAATLFPSGPLKSQLSKVLLEELAENRTLTSPKIKVMTQSDSVALSENSQFAFPVEDRRFEQVQAFFYLSQALDWCAKNLNFQLPFSIEAETSVGFPEKTNTAFYYQHRVRLGDGDDATFSRIPLDPSIVIHESFHAVVEAVARLPYEGEGGSLNEAFADFFTTTILQNPNLGEAAYKKGPFKRTVNNSLKLSEKDGGLYHDSGIVSGLLWSLQKSLGKAAGVQLAWSTLLRLTPDTKFAEFKTELLGVINQLPADQQGKALQTLKDRGWAE